MAKSKSSLLLTIEKVSGVFCHVEETGEGKSWECVGHYEGGGLMWEELQTLVDLCRTHGVRMSVRASEVNGTATTRVRFSGGAA